MPLSIKQKFEILVKILRKSGPTGPCNWNNCSKLSKHKYHCQLSYHYMKKLGTLTLNRFTGKILNTHPALLPKFGGKGIYGMNVHKAVVNSGEKESGISIHMVDSEYDTGPVIRQCKVNVYPTDTPELLCERVMNCERKFVVETLQKIANKELLLDIV